MTGVGLAGDITGQYGSGYPPRDQYNGRNIHPRVSRIQRCLYGLTETTPRRSFSVHTDVTAICGGYHPEFWDQCCWISADDGGSAMVHHQMLLRSRQHLDDRECHCSAQRDPLGIGAAGSGWPQCQTRPDIGILEGGGDSSSTDGGGIGRHIGPFTPAMATLMPGQEDVDHGTFGEGGAVLDGLHPGDRLLSFQERGHPVTMA